MLCTCGLTQNKVRCKGCRMVAVHLDMDYTIWSTRTKTVNCQLRAGFSCQGKYFATSPEDFANLRHGSHCRQRMTMTTTGCFSRNQSPTSARRSQYSPLNLQLVDFSTIPINTPVGLRCIRMPGRPVGLQRFGHLRSVTLHI